MSKTTKQTRSTKVRSVKSSNSTLDRAREVFRTLNLRYTMKTFRFCAENGIVLDDLRDFTPKNHLDLVMLGTPNIDPEEAEAAIEKFLAETDLGMPALHALCLEAAKAAGFFMKESDLNMVGELMKDKEDTLSLILPIMSREIQAVLPMLQVFLPMILQGYQVPQEQAQTQGENS